MDAKRYRWGANLLLRDFDETRAAAGNETTLHLGGPSSEVSFRTKLCLAIRNAYFEPTHSVIRGSLLGSTEQCH